MAMIISPSQPSINLFQRGNMGLFHLLMILYDHQPNGLTMSQLFVVLKSRSYTHQIVKRAVAEGLIERVQNGKVLDPDITKENLQKPGKPVYIVESQKQEGSY
jgi:hypothetical protein